MNKKNFNKNKELLFLEPIKPEMSVDEIYNKLIRIFEIKGIKIYPETNQDRGN